MRKALIIAGPTGVGKSAFAERIALKYKLPIISADSRQIFRELNIGVGKPKEEILKKIDYFEINSCSIHDSSDVVQYLARVADIIAQTKGNLIIAGGTGFYIKALLDGIDILPSKNEALRIELNQLFIQKGVRGLQSKYLKIGNPYLKVDLNNPQRLIRAIEIGEQKELKRIPSPFAEFETCIIGLNREREKLYHRINSRVDEMMADGLLTEVQNLKNEAENINLKTVGYSELFEHFEGKMSLAIAVDKIKQHSRNYAKRQLTYFNHQLNLKWFDAEDIKNLDSFVTEYLL